MFDFLKRTKEENAIAIEEPSLPSAHAKPSASLTEPRDSEDEWLSLSVSVGASPPRTDLAELLRFLREELIPTYPTQSVFNYLTTEARMSASGTWDFWPMRACDVGEKAGWASVTEWPSDMGATKEAVYRQAIPIPALVTAKRLIDHFGGDVKFFVAQVDDDPFLAVRLRQSNIIFVERWDEPGFRS